MNIIAIGESTYDISFKNGKPVEARVGGSLINTAVSLGRLGAPVSVVTACGSDEIGSLTVEFLIKNNINPSFITVYQGTSRIALAFLDEQNNAHYSFYNGECVDNKLLTLPVPGGNELVVFGSAFGIRADLRSDLVQFLKQSGQSGNIVYYDPNVRPGQIEGPGNAKQWILDNICISHIVKGSCEDFNLIFNTYSSQEVYHIVKEINANVILLVTAGERGADLYSPTIRKHIDVSPIIPISTIGAGDSFTAGIVFGLYKANVNADNLLNLSENFWDQTLQYAVDIASEVCMSHDNYIGLNSTINCEIPARHQNYQ